jgi:hypothetical protein
VQSVAVNGHMYDDDRPIESFACQTLNTKHSDQGLVSVSGIGIRYRVSATFFGFGIGYRVSDTRF